MRTLKFGILADGLGGCSERSEKRRNQKAQTRKVEKSAGVRESCVWRITSRSVELPCTYAHERASLMALGPIFNKQLDAREPEQSDPEQLAHVKELIGKFDAAGIIASTGQNEEDEEWEDDSDAGEGGDVEMA